ncbi:MAG: VOC family protein [Gammaproteobacteria bacterium]|jgi:catechol 2,3-dioxygenase-like lactoylglutathione lyase family enzyme
MKSLFPDICSDAVQKSKKFYVDLFGFNVLFDIGWYVQLCSPSDENLQIAFVDRNHTSVPEGYRKNANGFFVTVEVDNADEIYQRAKQLDIEIQKEICNEAWGQRHFFAVDPNGLLVDVYHMIDADPEFLKQHGLLEAETI